MSYMKKIKSTSVKDLLYIKQIEDLQLLIIYYLILIFYCPGKLVVGVEINHIYKKYQFWSAGGIKTGTVRLF